MTIKTIMKAGTAGKKPIPIRLGDDKLVKVLNLYAGIDDSVFEKTIQDVVKPKLEALKKQVKA
jgi:hypothetical protein